MARELVCPGCRRVLEVPDDPQAPTLTCPRCLAEVPDPRAAAITGRPATLGREVGKDSQWVQAGLGAAIFLGSLAFLFGFHTGRDLGPYGDPGVIALGAFLCFGLPVAVGAIIAVRGIWLLRAAYWVGGILVLLLALFIFFFVACTGVILEQLRHI
jgi:hypothetical protein